VVGRQPPRRRTAAIAPTLARALRLTVRAKPGARAPGISRSGEVVVVAVRERAIEGQANDAIVRAVATWLDIAPSRVTVERGTAARIKQLALTDVTEVQLAHAVERLPRG